MGFATLNLPFRPSLMFLCPGCHIRDAGCHIRDGRGKQRAAAGGAQRAGQTALGEGAQGRVSTYPRQ
jgi:hypothetical protein